MNYIKFAVLLLVALAIAAILVACGAETPGQNSNDIYNNETNDYDSDNNETHVYDTSNEQDNENDILSEAPVPPAPIATPTPPDASISYAPPDEPSNPGYITIMGRQFSTTLTELYLSRWGLENHDIQPLRYMTNLTSLDLNHSPISDFTPLAGLTNLTVLRILDNEATDLTPLAELTNLTTLEMSLRYFQDTDITPLTALTGLTCFRLSLGGNQTDDISRLADLTNLTRLDLWHNQVSDISPLAGLTNLRHLDLSFNNQITDISPLANLTNLNTLSLEYYPGMDMSILYNIPPRIASPVVVAAESPHPFADALAGFFVNLTTAGWYGGMPYSYHAVLVDVDGQGTPGVVASRWAFDDRSHPFSFFNFLHIHPSNEQRLFFMYGNQLHEAQGQWGVAPSGRLVALAFTGACDILMTEYILLDIIDGQLVGVKSISNTEQTWGDNHYAVNYHINDFLASDFEQMQSLTRAEFDELMARYGLHGTIANIWELPDDTYKVLAMPAS